MWFLQIVRSFFFTLDSTLFNLIPTVYDFLITISRTSILTQGQIKMFSDRIQALLGVFMLFKVTFSLITYIINPDDFSEKSKGFGKLWQNVIVTLIILILSPYAFSMAYDLQAMILDDNTLAGLVFGDNQEDYNYINTAGEKMAYTVMEPFFSPNTSLRSSEKDITLDECTTLYEIDENGKKTFNSDCRDAIEKIMDDNSTSSTSYLNNYIAGVENENLGLLFRLEIAKKTVVVNGDEEFLIDYMVPVSTVVVVIVLLILITFCLDVALRSVKLAFLQLISPIPIISYIDPKSGKDGMFKKWYQMCFSTYLSLFVRLLALYLAIYIIGLINSMTDVVTGAEVSNPWIKIFIIIGVLMFAKQLPKILEGFGIKLDGDGKFTLNPFKKMEDQALGGKQILGGAKGLAAGAAIGAIGMASGAGLGRVLTGAVGGLTSGISGKKFGDIRRDQAQRNMNAIARRIDGVGYGSVFRSNMQQALGVETEGAKLSRQNSELEQFSKSVAGLKSETESMVEKRKNDLKMSDIGVLSDSSGRSFDTKTLSLAQAENLVSHLQQDGQIAEAARLSNEIFQQKKTLSEKMAEVAMGDQTELRKFQTGGEYMMGTAAINDFNKAIAYATDAQEASRTGSVKEIMKNYKTGSDAERYRNAAKEAENMAIQQKSAEKAAQKIDKYTNRGSH